MKLLFILLTLCPQIDTIIQQAISDKLIPGAVVCKVENEQITYLEAFGNRAITPKQEKMTTSTIFDLASCSKSTGAGTLIMQLAMEGRLNVDDPVKKYLPLWPDSARVRHLLTHTSGLPGYLYAIQVDKSYMEHRKTQKIKRPQFLIDTICLTPRLSGIGEKYRYSCLNFITLQNVAQKIVGTDINTYLRHGLYKDLDMEVMGWLPKRKYRSRIAPTEYLYSGTFACEKYNRSDSTKCLRGIVHDPLARIMNGGVSGNAGLFATAEDLSKWCIWFMNLPQEEREKGCNAGLWVADDGSLWHTGYTGTLIHLYPEKKTAVILLTNRVHPQDKKGIRQLCDDVTKTLLSFH